MEKIISVAVISYNSSKTILQTLESVKNQSYDSSNIELVISDDGSIDNTCDVINQWLDKYHASFYAVKTNFSKKNKGVSANCNISFSLCSGEWVKIIAADDVLLVDCIERNVIRANKTDFKVIFSKMQAFRKDKLLPKVFPSLEQQYIFLAKNLNEQLVMLRKYGGFRCAPTSFIHRDAINYLGELNEAYTLIEDYPMWIKLSDKYKFDFFDEITVKYRVEESTSNSSLNICNVEYLRQKIEIEMEQYEKESNWITKQHIISRVKDYKFLIFITSIFGVKRTLFNRMIIKIHSVISITKFFCKLDKIKKK